MAKKPDGPPLPHQPAKYHLADLSAVQALAAGKATAEQQKRALRWIVEDVCLTYDLGWHPEGAHAASFVAGRRFAGLQIVKAATINVAALRKAEEHG